MIHTVAPYIKPVVPYIRECACMYSQHCLYTFLLHVSCHINHTHFHAGPTADK